MFARRGISPSGILSWVTLILTEYAKVEPIIAADLAAGKTYLQILEDCLAALIRRSGRGVNHLKPLSR